MALYAIKNNKNEIENIIEWDGQTQFNLPGKTLLDISNDPLSQAALNKPSSISKRTVADKLAEIGLTLTDLKSELSK